MMFLLMENTNKQHQKRDQRRRNPRRNFPTKGQNLKVRNRRRFLLRLTSHI
jgi:hypothetical protein